MDTERNENQIFSDPEESVVIVKGQHWKVLLGIFIPVLLTISVAFVFKTSNLAFSVRMVWGGLFYLGLIAILALYAVKVEQQPFLIWKEERKALWFYLWTVLCPFAVFYAVTYTLFFLKIRIPIEHSDLLEKMRLVFRQSTLILVLTAFRAGLTEELFFRGYLMPRLKFFVKDTYLAVFITALLFSAVHFRYQSITELVFTFIFGLYTGLHYQKYRNIRSLIIFHVTWDLFSSILLVLHHVHK